MINLSSSIISSSIGRRYSSIKSTYKCIIPNIQKLSYSTLKYPITHFNEDQQILRQSVRKFVEAEILPNVRNIEEEGIIPSYLINSLFIQGYMGIEIPQDYGGSEMTFTDSLIVIEEISRVDPSVAVMVDVHNTLINRCLMDYGTAQQKEIYLPQLAQDSVGSFCLSESSSGSDAFALTTKAEKHKNGWKINGTKQWISNSQEASIFIVFANSNFLQKHRGITAFIIDASYPGVQVGQSYSKLGIKSSSTCEVKFDNVFVPNENVLGNIGEGYKIAINSLNEGRIGIAAQMLGLAEGAFSATFPYLFERKQFGDFIGNFQAVRFQYAEVATQIEMARLFVYNAAALKENKMSFTKEAAMAKLMSSRVAERVASQCVEFLGGNGFTTNFPVEKFFRDSKIGSIYEGTSNIQLETIAKCVKQEKI